MTNAESDQTREAVREGYARIAQGETLAHGTQATGASSCCGSNACCGSAPTAAEELARTVGYALEDLQALPAGANLGLSCGNPVALAALRPGEVVVDLGSGGGFDVFIAGRRVGPTGRAIGIDMTPEMLARARRNIAGYRESTGLDNVEFRLGEIEHLPLADASVDAIISNCVINLSPEKAQVWREMARVLRPGGRVAVSDLALLQPLPAAVRAQVQALVGCIAGAQLIEETEAQARAAGLIDLKLTRKDDYIRTLHNWQDPLYQAITRELPAGAQIADYVTSLEISARKPAAQCSCCSGV